MCNLMCNSKPKQPPSTCAKWLFINERETRFELATLSLGSYVISFVISCYCCLSVSKPLFLAYQAY